jgi:hypothetical protein
MEDLNLRKLRLIEFILAEHNEESIERLEKVAYRIAYDEDSKTKVIGFRPDGVAVIKSDFLDGIVQTMKEVERGEYLTLEQLETRSDSW